MAFTGITSNTRKNIQLDAGALYKNYQVGTDTPATATAKLIGATQGGATLAIVPEIRQIAADGAKGPTKGYEVCESWTCTLTANLIETTKEAVALALGAATVTASTPTGYSTIQPDSDIADSDYINNVVWVGKISGSANPVMIELDNVLSLNGLNYTVADKAEGVIPLTLTAHYDVTNLESVPCKIYTPTIPTTTT